MPTGSPRSIRFGSPPKFYGTRDIAGYRLGTTEPLVQASLERHLVEGDVLYDVGANVGFFSLLGARLVGPRGTVVAFEPLPRNVDAL
jgi:hypothetical protein